MKKKGVVHSLPLDLRKAINASPKAASSWKDITSLARNEWICWVTSGKKAETRGIRIEKTISKLSGACVAHAVLLAALTDKKKPPGARRRMLRALQAAMFAG